MQFIGLTQGQVAIVDDSNYEELSKYNWHAAWNPGTQSYYAMTVIKYKGNPYRLQMGRLILGMRRGDKDVCDHINHDTLDNREANIRKVSQSKNLINTKKPAKGYTKRYNGKYAVNIRRNNKFYYLGTFDTPTQARKARMVWLENYSIAEQ